MINDLFFFVGYGTLSDTVLIWRFHGTMYDAVTIAKIIVYALTNPKFITFKAFNQYYHHHNHVIKVRNYMNAGYVSSISLQVKRIIWLAVTKWFTHETWQPPISYQSCTWHFLQLIMLDSVYVFTHSEYIYWSSAISVPSAFQKAEETRTRY